MRNAFRVVSIVLIVAVITPSSYGQFWDKLTNPQITVTLRHPPGLGLTVKRIAFAPISNATSCADQFLDAVGNDFIGSGAEVVDRQNLEAMLSEHRFSLTEFVDQQAKAQLGKMLGPAALVFVKVMRCAPESKRVYDDWKDLKGIAHRTYISRATQHFKASVRTVDLTTGKTLAAIPIEITETRENKTVDEGWAEFPSEYELLDEAIRKGVVEAHRMFFPWTENRELYFFDDEPCGLKTAFRLLKGGDQEGALRQSESNVETCKAMTKVKPKIIWHAHYNVGMANFILGNHDKALQHFSDASAAGGGDIVAQSMAECRRAKQLAEQMRRVEERPPLDTPPPTTTKVASNTKTPAKAVESTEDVETKLKKLKSMLDKGLITKAEYDKKKSELLSSF